MRLGDAIERLQKYSRKLESGKADKIKPAHVHKVIDKLTAKHSELAEDLADAKKSPQKKRIAEKLETTRKQLKRARKLLAEVENSD